FLGIEVARHNTQRKGPQSTRSFIATQNPNTTRQTEVCRTLSLRRSFLTKILSVEGVIKPPDHHLLPRLRTPTHFLARIGIELVPLGVVVMSYAVDAASLRRRHRLLQKVIKLPV